MKRAFCLSACLVALGGCVLLVALAAFFLYYVSYRPDSKPSSLPAASSPAPRSNPTATVHQTRSTTTGQARP